ncbi:MAG: hypothetical protein AB8B72_11535 [Crocinitomicaceae bacterium]
MNIESIKINIAKQLFNIKNEALLNKIQSIIDKEAIVAHTTSGEPLTLKAYKKRLEKGKKQIQQGKSISHEDLKNEMKKW